MPKEIIGRFYRALPDIQNWIDELLRSHEGRARAVSESGFQRLSACFPQDILEQTRFVVVPSVPVPPLDRFGLPELSDMQQMAFSGMTFKDTLFLRQGHIDESLYFHELVHVVQWQRLGADNFLLAYGLGLFIFGYETSPLEQMAYTLQSDFEDGSLPHDLVAVIHQRTDEIWQQAAKFLQDDKD